MLSKVCSRMDERCLGECDAGPSCLSSSVSDVPVSITDEEMLFIVTVKDHKMVQ